MSLLCSAELALASAHCLIIPCACACVHSKVVCVATRTFMQGVHGEHNTKVRIWDVLVVCACLLYPKAGARGERCRLLCGQYCRFLFGLLLQVFVGQ